MSICTLIETVSSFSQNCAIFLSNFFFIFDCISLYNFLKILFLYYSYILLVFFYIFEAEYVDPSTIRKNYTEDLNSSMGQLKRCK
jgi:hypothetical protein